MSAVLTGSMRRKLYLGLGLVLLMMLAQAGSSMFGMQSYRSVIRDLDHGINEAPHHDELMSAIAMLFEPVLLNVTGEAGAELQQTRFLNQLRQSRLAVQNYRRKLEEMPSAELQLGQKPVTDAMLNQIAVGFDKLEHLSTGLVVEGLRDDVARQMLQEVGKLQIIAQKVPESGMGMHDRLNQARGVYRTVFVVVGISSVVAIALFLGLWRFGHLAIDIPLRTLHDGFIRVKQGDFSYRVRIHTKDEMEDLASTFNEMTERVEEMKRDLDRQVEERSQQLVRSERLAGVGFLAAGVAHEINNPLMAIATAAEAIADRMAPLAPTTSHTETAAAPAPAMADPADIAIVRQYLAMIQNESFRCKEITGRLLDFSRGRDSVRELHDLTDIVKQVVAMVQHLGKYRQKKIVFETQQSVYAEVNGPELKQVVLNLIANGLEAMDAGGVLHIGITEQTDTVHLTFRDEGVGMDASILSHMFEPFFTTKEGGQGTGLGLSITHRIVTQHGGTIYPESAGPGTGSTFHVRLPRRASLTKVA